jgi:predicted nucleotidyltransferase
MRLDNKQKEALCRAIEGIEDEIYLFGSRVDAAKKGGDIDILIFSEENPYRLSQRVATQFFMECEEKIDVIVTDPDNLTPEQTAFLNTITMERLK